MKYLIRLVLISYLFLPYCSPDNGKNPTKNDDIETEWRYGSENSYTINASTTFNIVDDITGFNFIFPDGGNGILEIKKINDGAPLEFESIQFEVNFSGTSLVLLKLSKDSDEEIAVFGHYTIYNTVLDGSDKYTNWWGIPSLSESDSEIIFSLQAESGLAKENTTSPDVNKFAVSRLKNNSTMREKTTAIRTSVQQCIDYWLVNLPPNLRTAAQSEISGDLSYSIVWSNNGNSYVHGDNWIASNSTFYFTSEASLATVAHEVGHYMHHVLCGYEEYNAMYNRFPKDFWGAAVAHDLGDYREGRIEILEDIAQFSQYMILGDIDNHDASNVNKINSVYNLCNQKDPDQVDYPSHEGFGVWLLASLLRTENEIYTYRTNSPKVKVPIAGAQLSDILNIIDSGPDNINELREFAEASLLSKGGDYQYMLPALLEPIGWSYNGMGYVLDENDQPVTDATVISVCYVGSKQYYTRKTTETGSNGKFYLDRIFPGTNILRVYTNNGSDSSDFTFFADWNELTKTTLDIGNLKISSDDILSILHNTTQIGGEITGLWYSENAFEAYIDVKHTYWGENFDTSYTSFDYISASGFKDNFSQGSLNNVIWSNTTFTQENEYERVNEIGRIYKYSWKTTGSVSADGKTLISAKQEYKYNEKLEMDKGNYGGYDLSEIIEEQMIEFKNIPIKNWDTWNLDYAEYYLSNYNLHKQNAVVQYVKTEKWIQKNQEGNIISNGEITTTLKNIITDDKSDIQVYFRGF